MIRPFDRSGDEPAEVAALDPLTGRTVWTCSFPDRTPRYPSFDGTDLFYPLYGRRGDGPAPPGRVAVLDPATGDERRRLPRSIQGFAPIGRGRLFSAAWASERLLAVDAGSGETDWEQSVRFRHPRPDDEGIVNARYRFGGLTDDRLLVHEHLHGYLPDELRGLDPATGEVRWTVGAGDDPLVQFNRPVVAGGTAYVGGTVRPHDLEVRTGLLRAYDVATGALERSVELPSPRFVPPVVADGRVFVACQDGVRAFG